jgi:hypothetical protein
MAAVTRFKRSESMPTASGETIARVDPVLTEMLPPIAVVQAIRVLSTTNNNVCFKVLKLRRVKLVMDVSFY